MKIFIIAISIFSFSVCIAKPRILIFSKTTGFRHESIDIGKKSLLKLCILNNILADTSENSDVFTIQNLKKYQAILFLSTSGDIFNEKQQLAFEKFIQSGKGFVGVHAASDTEYDWPWYCSLVGGNFNGHPEIQNADLQIVESKHNATNMLPLIWKRKDEWYNFKNLNPNTKTLIKIDEKSYKGGEMHENHPMSWFHNFDGGRAFYTAFGHTNESYSEDLFLKHILGGIKYAIKK